MDLRHLIMLPWKITILLKDFLMNTKKKLKRGLAGINTGERKKGRINKIQNLIFTIVQKIAKILNIHQTWPNSILKVSRIPRRLVLYIIGNVTRYIMVSFCIRCKQIFSSSWHLNSIFILRSHLSHRIIFENIEICQWSKCYSRAISILGFLVEWPKCPFLWRFYIHWNNYHHCSSLLRTRLGKMAIYLYKNCCWWIGLESFIRFRAN